MNCDEFLELMHRCIDDRIPFASEERLTRHAGQCPSCRGQLNAWSQIAVMLPAAVSKATGDEKQRQRFRPASLVGFASAVAAVWALIIFMPTQTDPVVSSPMNTAVSTEDSTTGFTVGRTVDAAHWWDDVRGRDWVAQTMPAVRNVRDGVAPLGRSILQAVSILTIGGGEQTS